MELILKKTKLTGNILNQTTIASYLDLHTFDVIGWCIHKSYKWIIFYKPNTNQIRKGLMITDVVTYVENNQYKVKIRFEDDINILTHSLSDEDEQQKVYNNYNRIKTEAISKGQFFI